MAKNEESAIMRQYNDMKKQTPDSLLLFRCGDFYETYQEDAKECAKILGITLTKKNDVSMAGFPHHALDQYLPKLIRAGKRVAICDLLPDPPKKPVKRGITELVNANENKPETSNLKHETNEKEDKDMKPETSNMKPTMAADLIGKTIILGATGAKYVVKSVNGDKLECDFSNGKATIPMGVPVSQAEKFLASGTWKIEGEEPATAAPTSAISHQPSAIKTEADVAEVDDIMPKVTPSVKADGGSKTEEVKPTAPETCNVKPETKAKPAPKVKIKSETKPQTSSVSPQTSKGKLTYSTYDVAKKNKKTGKDYTVQNAKIAGFDLTDAVYLAGASFNGGLLPETIDGKQVGTLRFSYKWRETAKAICDKLNAGGSVQDCVAIMEQAKADRKQKINERIQKRAEREAKAQTSETRNLKPETKVYTQAELAEWLRKLNAGTDKEKAEAAKFFNDLAKAA